MADRKEIRVPDIGDFEDVEIIEVHVSEGDRVEREDPLITLETDKASMDVPTTAAGKVAKLAVGKGDRVSEGDLIVELEPEEARQEKTAEDKPAEEKPAEEKGEAEKAEGETPEGEGGETVVKVPDIGDFEDVEIIEVHVSEGDRVEREDPLITLETDKASMDVPSTAAGEVVSLAVGKGDRVSEGDAIVTLRVAGEKPPREEEPAAEAREEPGEAREEERGEREETEESEKAEKAEKAGKGRARGHVAAPGRLPPVDEAGFAKAHASPSVRRFARELGVDLGRVRGSGLKGRITADDVKAFVKSVMAGSAAAPAAAGLPAVPEVDFSKWGETETKPLTRIQKISGPRLHASWVNLPHVTQFDEADITDLEDLRQNLKEQAAKRGAKLTPLAFLVVACVNALKEFPVLNSSLDASGENLVFKQYFHVGFAADTPNGLVVPVLKDADKKTLLEIAKELNDLSGRARDGKLKADDMQGGCFTISSLGSIGGTAFTPIINAPEVAILGVSRAATRPVWKNGEFVPRLVLPLSLSYDHRVVDGALAVRFTRFLAEQLEDPDVLMLS